MLTRTFSMMMIVVLLMATLFLSKTMAFTTTTSFYQPHQQLLDHFDLSDHVDPISSSPSSQQQQQQRVLRQSRMVLFAEVERDQETTVTISESSIETDAVSSIFQSSLSTASVYDQIGITKDQLALGIDANEVLQYIGTRQDLVNRMIQDIPKLDTTKAEAEVDKLLMDAEMLNSFLQYEKAKANDKEGMFTGGSSTANSEYELSLRNPKVIATYAAWIGGGIGFSYIRRNYIQPKIDSGEWQDFKFVLPNPMDWLNGGSGGGDIDTVAADAVLTSTMMLANPHEMMIGHAGAAASVFTSV